MNYTFTFTPEQLQVLNDGLIALPYGKVAPLIVYINQGIKAQEDNAAQADLPTT